VVSEFLATEFLATVTSIPDSPAIRGHSSTKFPMPLVLDKVSAPSEDSSPPAFFDVFPIILTRMRSRQESHQLAYCAWVTLALTTVAFCCFWSSSRIVILLPWMVNLTSSPRAMLAGLDQGKFSFWRTT
jgi:hypothetical protein